MAELLVLMMVGLGLLVLLPILLIKALFGLLFAMVVMPFKLLGAAAQLGVGIAAVLGKVLAGGALLVVSLGALLLVTVALPLLPLAALGLFVFLILKIF